MQTVTKERDPMHTFNPISKDSQLHRVRVHPKSKNFTEKVKSQIFERDDYKCVRCGTMNDLESVPHHIIYKSAGGMGTLDNGCCVCRECHRLAHSQANVRKWFEEYKVKNFQ